MARQEADRLVRVYEKRYWREADARAVFTAWQRSGVSLSRFARDNGFQPQRMGWWASRWRPAQKDKDALRFHPVRVVGGTAAGSGRLVSEGIEVVLVDGRRIRLPRGFAAEDLRRLLAVLGEEAAC